MQFIAPQLYTEAVHKIGSKSPIGSKLNSEEWSGVPLALRERAFFSSTIESIRFLQRGRDMVTDFLSGARETLPTGELALKAGSRAEFVKQMSAFAISEGMGPLDPEDKGSLKDITSQTRLNLIFDVQQQSADDYGYWKQGMDPDVLDEFPAQRFVREVDVKQPRIIHQENEGVVRRKDDLEFWLGMNSPAIGGFGVPWGPWGFNSGMGVEDVDRAESESLGLVQPGETIAPVEKDFNDTLKASVQGLDPDMVSKLQDAFGDQVDITDGAAVWATPGASPVAVPLPPIGGEGQGEGASGAGASGQAAAVNQSPVSDAITITTRDSVLKKQIQLALDAIDQTHDDGKLPPLNVISKSTMHALGSYQPGGARIAINPTGDHPALTMAHEVGHFLDEMAIGKSNVFSSVSDPLLAGWRKAAKASDAVTRLVELQKGTGPRRYLDYLLQPVEIFARSYAQYIAETSGDPTLMSDLTAAVNDLRNPNRQWSTTDFAPIRAEFDKLFKSFNWI